MLQSILGQPQQRQQFDDFSQRYQQGAPWDGISDDEAARHYQQVAGRLPPDVYEQSAEQAFSRLSPQQRGAFGQWLREQGHQRGLDFPDVDRDGRDDRLQDPGVLARMAGRAQQQQPDLFGQLLGGGGGGMLQSPIAKAALGGIAAMAFQRVLGGRR